ncbi:MAG: transposase [Synergistetes bacterium]|nr:transposase [Synergistota bacterium]
MDILNGNSIFTHLKKERDGNIKIKLVGLNLIHIHGKTVSDISEILGISPRTAYRWIKEWNTNGYSGIAVKPPSPGRPPKLDRKKISILKDKMKCRLFWRVEDVRITIKTLFDLDLSDVQVRRILKNSMGMTSIRPYFYDESRINIYSVSVKGLRDVIYRLEKEGYPPDLIGIGVLKKHTTSRKGLYSYNAIVGNDTVVDAKNLTEDKEIKRLLLNIHSSNNTFCALVVAIDCSIWYPHPSQMEFNIIPQFFIWCSK